MQNYRAAVGHDADDGVMVKLYPQPRGSGEIPVDRQWGLTGKGHDDQTYMILHFDMIESEEVYWDLLLSLGISVDISSPVTIRARDKIFVERKFNGVAHQPMVNDDVRWEGGFIRNVDIHITHLEEIGS